MLFIYVVVFGSVASPYVIDFVCSSVKLWGEIAFSRLLFEIKVEYFFYLTYYQHASIQFY